MLHRRNDGGGGATTSKHDDSRPCRLASEQCSGSGVETAHVGIVPVQPPGFEPERVHRSHTLGDIRELVAAGVDRDLVWNGDVTGNAEILQFLEKRAKIAGQNARRFYKI